LTYFEQLGSGVRAPCALCISHQTMVRDCRQQVHTLHNFGGTQLSLSYNFWDGIPIMLYNSVTKSEIGDN